MLVALGSFALACEGRSLQAAAPKWAYATLRNRLLVVMPYKPGLRSGPSRCTRRAGLSAESGLPCSRVSFLAGKVDDLHGVT